MQQKQTKVQPNAAWLIASSAKQAFALVGEQEAANRAFCLEVAQNFLCEAASAELSTHARQTCRCCQSVAQAQHPDWMVLDGYDAAKARGLVGFLQQQPRLGRCSVTVLYEIHQASSICQNSWLKAFEELPPHCRLLATTNHWQQLLPTLRSRFLRVAVPQHKADPTVSKLAQAFVEAVSCHEPQAWRRGIKLAAALRDQGGFAEVATLLRRTLWQTMRTQAMAAQGAWLDDGLLCLLGELPKLETAAMHANPPLSDQQRQWLLEALCLALIDNLA